MSLIFRNFKPGFKRGSAILLILTIAFVVATPFMPPIAVSIFTLFYIMIVCSTIIELVTYVLPRKIMKALSKK